MPPMIRPPKMRELPPELTCQSCDAVLTDIQCLCVTRCPACSLALAPASFWARVPAKEKTDIVRRAHKAGNVLFLLGIGHIDRHFFDLPNGEIIDFGKCLAIGRRARYREWNQYLLEQLPEGFVRDVARIGIEYVR